MPSRRPWPRSSAPPPATGPGNAGVSRAEVIRELIDRAIGGHPGADLAADLAAISGSFGVLAGQAAFSRARDERMDYLDRLAGE
jgi:hypothetical protein